MPYSIFSSILTAFFFLATLLSALSAPAQVMPTPAALLNSTGTADGASSDLNAQVASDGAGNWVSVWASEFDLNGTTGTDNDILVTRSTDAGATWTSTALLNSTGTDDGDSNDGAPRVTSDGAGNWVAVWYSTYDLNGTAGTDNDIFTAQSTDAGVTWTSPALLNSTGTADGSGGDVNPQVKNDGAGNWVAVWQSAFNLNNTAGSDEDIFVARSTDAGATWTSPALLNSTGTADGGRNDQLPEVTSDGAGNWVAVWQSEFNLNGTTGNDYDILVARSTDAGATWTSPALLNTTGSADGSGDFYPQVTSGAAGMWIAVWHSNFDLDGTAGSDFDIFMARSTDAGVTWTAPALLNDTGTADGSSSDERPKISSDGAGNWIAAWHSNFDLNGTAGTDYDIFVSHSTDAGAIWTSPALFNSTGTADGTSTDASPGLANDGTGSWVAAWHSNFDLNGTAGTDYDILVSTLSNIENTLPEAIAITTATPSPTTLTSVNFLVDFDEDVLNFNDAADLIITHTATFYDPSTHAGVSITGSGAQYVVTVSGIGGMGTITLAVDTGSDVEDLEGNALTSSVTSDPLEKYISSMLVIYPVSTTETSTGPVSFIVKYSGAAAVTLEESDIAVMTSGDAAGTVSVSGSGTSERTVTISSITGNGETWIELIQFSAEDPEGAPFGYGEVSGSFYVDNLPPAFTIGAPTGSPVRSSGTATYPVAISGISYSFNFQASDITLLHDGTAGGNVSILRGPFIPGAVTVDVDVEITGVTGNGSYRISIAAGAEEDAVGNTSLATGPSAEAVIVDNNGPSATGITTESTSPTNASSVAFTVEFDEAVQFFNDEADLNIMHTGTTHAAVNVSGSGATYTVTVTGITGDGSFTLAVDTESGVQDMAGNLLGASVTSTAVVIDNTAPNAISISTTTPSPTHADSVDFTVEFDEPVQAFDDAADLIIEHTGTENGGVTITGSGDTYTVTVFGITGEGSFVVAANSGSNVTDLAANPLAGSVTSGAVTKYIPIFISTIEELQLIGNDPAYPLNGSYVIENDIDASDTINWNGGAGFDPIADGLSQFSGSLDGQGHVIDGLYINRPSARFGGLFGSAVGSDLRNLGLMNVDITVWHSVGALAGSYYGSITNCYASGTVKSGATAGGLVGYFEGSMSDSHASTMVLSEAAAGGLAGEIVLGAISTSYATGAVSGSSTAGGLVGSSIGFDNQQQLFVSDSYATGSVSGTNAGGILGQIFMVDVQMHRAYATGAVAGGSTGGLIGLVLTPGSQVEQSFWDVDLSGTANSAGGTGIPMGGTGLPTEDMMQAATFTGADWDFDAVWDIVEGQSYPFLRENAQTPPPHEPHGTVSITPNIASPTHADSIEFTVIFTGPVQNFDDADNVIVSHTGTQHEGITITGSGDTYTVTVSGITGTGSFSLAVDTESDIQDSLGAPVEFSVTSEEVVVDNTAPSAISITTLAASPTTAASVDFTVTFDEPVENFNDESDVIVTDTETAGHTGITISGSGDTYTVTVADITGDGSLTVAVDTESGVTDLAGIPLAFSVTSEEVVIDNTGPSVLSITPSPSGPTNADVIVFEVVFDEPATLYETSVSLDHTGTSHTSMQSVNTGSATSTVSDTSIVTISGITGDGSFVLSTDAFVQDPAGNRADSGFSSPAVVIDNTLPTAITITTSATSPTNADSVDFSVTFDEPVENFNDAADVTVTHTGTTHTGASTAGSGDTYTVTVSGISGDGSFTVEVNPGDGVADLGGNGLGSSVISDPVAVDNTGPVVTIGEPDKLLVNSSATVTWPLTVTGFDLGNLTAGAVTIHHNGTAGGSIVAFGGPTATPYAEISGVTGDGSYTISIDGVIAADFAGNDNAAVGPSEHAVAVDNTGPVVTIGEPDKLLVNSSATVTWPLTVTGFDLGNLTAGAVTIHHNGTAGGSIVAFGGPTATPYAEISGVTGDGSYTISIDGIIAADFAGNKNAAVGPSDHAVTVDNTGPVVTIGEPDKSLVNSSRTVTWPLNVTGFDFGNLTEDKVTIHHNGTAGGSIVAFGGPTATPYAEISGVTGDGSYTISIGAGIAADFAGNMNLAVGPSASAVTVDNTPPEITVSAPSANSAVEGDAVSYLVTYTGANAIALAPGHITLDKTGTANGNVAVSGSGIAERAVTISGISGDGTLGISLAEGTASDTAGNSTLTAMGEAFSVEDTRTTLYVNFSHAGAESGTLAEPFSTLEQAVTAAESGAIIEIAAGHSAETLTIAKNLRITAAGGTVRLGAALDKESNSALLSRADVDVEAESNASVESMERFSAGQNPEQALPGGRFAAENASAQDATASEEDTEDFLRNTEEDRLAEERLPFEIARDFCGCAQGLEGPWDVRKYFGDLFTLALGVVLLGVLGRFTTRR